MNIKAPLNTATLILTLCLVGFSAPLWAQANKAPLKLLMLGDSLTEGYGVLPEQAYPALVEQALQAKGIRLQVINGGESGSTSAGGLARINWYLRAKPDVVFIALGANDGLRGQSVSAMANNLTQIIEKSRKAGARVMLAGMKIPPNYGATYTQDFAAVYPKLAQKLEVPLLPFLLEGVAGDTALTQTDGLHPNARGQAIMARWVADFLLKHEIGQGR